MPLVVCVASCNGQTLDVGVVAEPDARLEESASEAAAPLGLTVDGVWCMSMMTGVGSPWPSWKVILEGSCGALGVVHGVMDSNAAFAYPQSCGIGTTIQWGMDSDGDAGVLYYAADTSRGSCTLATGPTTTTPNAPLDVRATVVHARNPSLSHVITYRSVAASVVLINGDSGEGVFDAELAADSDVLRDD